MTSMFEQSARSGRIVDTFRVGVLYGSLWAIGSSWATAIRGVVVEVLPGDVAILTEILSAFLTTLFGVGVALITVRRWRRDCCPKPLPPLPLPRPRAHTVFGPSSPPSSSSRRGPNAV